MKHVVLIFVLSSLLSCGSPYRDLMLGGSLSQESFHETIPMDFSKGLPLIKVEIQGSTYQFLLDTGAPNVISKELSEKIKHKVVATTKINDSQGGQKKQKSVRIDNIRIGSVDFENTGAIIIDYMKVYELSCMEFDGIIGSNLLSKAFWEIDYEKGTVSFSDKVSSFVIPEDAYKIPFVPKHAQQTPVVKIEVNNINYNKVTFDTGATGSLGLKVGSAESAIDSLEGVELTGSISSGVYGDGGVSSTKYAIVDSISIGKIKFSDQVVEFESKGSMTLGNRFLKNYRVIMDWNLEQISLIEVDSFDESEYKNFGWLPKIKEGQMFVNAIVKGSVAEEKGLKLGTRILQINDMDFRSLTADEGCVFLTSKVLKNLETINLIFLANGEEGTMSLKREVFVNAKKN